MLTKTMTNRAGQWARHLLFCSALAATGLALAQTAGDAPVAPRVPKDVTVHGDKRIDDYFWLRERDKPEVMAYLKAEADYTARYYQPLEGLRDKLYAEMVGRIKQADEGVPARDGAWWYSSRTLEGAQYPQFIRRAAQGKARAYDAAAPEQVILDLNELAKGRKFLAVNQASASPDGRRLAYSLDETGARDFQLQVRDLATGQDLPWVAKRTDGAVWAADSKTIFYITSNEARRRNQVWRHSLDGQGPDQLIYEEKDELYNLMLGRTADRRYLTVTSIAKDTTEVRILAADKPMGAWQVLLPRKSGVEYAAEHHAGRLFLRINDRGPNFRLAALPMPKTLSLTAAQLAQAQELLPHREDAALERLAVFKQHLVLQVREQGSVKLRVFDQPARLKAGAKSRDVAVGSEAVYTALVGDNRESDSDTLRLNYQSMTTPASVYDYGLASGQLTLRKQQPVIGYDASRYESRRLVATAKDGTQVPISLVYAKALRGEGPRPLLLRGYGSYGIPSDPRFNGNDLSLLDRGVVVAIAHIRGGGDLGRRWYLEGKLAKKMNSFTDFVAVAETLIQQGWTQRDKLVINGGSAGGLLMGAVVNLRPELFKAVVAEVPFVDVINTMLDESIPLTTEEFIEWGNPKIAEQYAWMRAYSPYDNLKAGAYPSILTRTGINDSQVPYWEPAKYVAKLRTLKSDGNPLLFDINLSAGHGGASGRFDALKERAKVYAFMLDQWGMAR
ncbi:S9 family peptidase [Pelomonas sp. SE-A7]|uniref:S9 family peptidase n=1 Tax=Pelomonas sp. SE-A7 TaxID=3054953 RepID=UPI00259C9093|nr:S9 family peptidase [Pelomonas sp. SE-A7]MDM4764781.1 S9 family peptidase [Pelomonas sp. SE-A7]